MVTVRQWRLGKHRKFRNVQLVSPLRVALCRKSGWYVWAKDIKNDTGNGRTNVILRQGLRFTFIVRKWDFSALLLCLYLLCLLYLEIKAFWCLVRLCGTAWSWRRGRYGDLKRRSLYSGRRVVTSGKIWIFRNTLVKDSEALISYLLICTSQTWFVNVLCKTKIHVSTRNVVFRLLTFVLGQYYCRVN